MLVICSNFKHSGSSNCFLRGQKAHESYSDIQVSNSKIADTGLDRQRNSFVIVLVGIVLSPDKSLAILRFGALRSQTRLHTPSPIPCVAKLLQTNINDFRSIYGVTDTDFKYLGINYRVTDTDLASLIP